MQATPVLDSALTFVQGMDVVVRDLPAVQAPLAAVIQRERATAGEPDA